MGDFLNDKISDEGEGSDDVNGDDDVGYYDIGGDEFSGDGSLIVVNLATSFCF